MSQEKKQVYRLFRVAKELNVGSATLVDHLSSKGYEVRNSPNEKLSSEMYTVLLKEYSSEKVLKQKAAQIRELKHQAKQKSEDPEPEKPLLSAHDLKNSLLGKLQAKSRPATEKSTDKAEVPEPGPASEEKEGEKIIGLKVVGKINNLQDIERRVKRDLDSAKSKSGNNSADKPIDRTKPETDSEKPIQEQPAPVKEEQAVIVEDKEKAPVENTEPAKQVVEAPVKESPKAEDQKTPASPVAEPEPKKAEPAPVTEAQAVVEAKEPVAAAKEPAVPAKEDDAPEKAPAPAPVKEEKPAVVDVKAEQAAPAPKAEAPVAQTESPATPAKAEPASPEPVESKAEPAAAAAPAAEKSAPQEKPEPAKEAGPKPAADSKPAEGGTPPEKEQATPAMEKSTPPRDQKPPQREKTHPPRDKSRPGSDDRRPNRRPERTDKPSGDRRTSESRPEGGPGGRERSGDRPRRHDDRGRQRPEKLSFKKPVRDRDRDRGKETEAPKAQASTEETAEKPPEKIEAKAQQLRGLKVLGKIELPGDKAKKTKDKDSGSSGSTNKDEDDDKPKRKRKRKRKRKTTPGSSPNQGSNTSSGTKSPPGKDGSKGPGKASPRTIDKKKKEEPTEKEIQEKIKASLQQIDRRASRERQRLRRAKRDEDARKREREERQRQEEEKFLEVTEFITANELANLMSQPVTAIITKCLELGMFVSINQRLEGDIISLLAEEYGYKAKFIDITEKEFEEVEEEEDPADLVERHPIVTVMGHVDHGKTSLLDYVRKANVIAGEAGGITQHIGAYEVTMPESGNKITFLDTPGHEAFTAMRARGAKVTDLVIVVVAADDAVMPQTKEAINHAEAAGVPIIFAINKVDKPSANPDKIKEQLAGMNYLVEDWGGEYQSQDISAKTGLGIDDLLEKVLIVSELSEFKANPDKNAKGAVIESKLDRGRGVTATLLVQEGTLKMGDSMVVGIHFARIRAMFDERGNRIKEAGPSTPVQVLGLTGTPQAGDRFTVYETERKAKEISNKRQELYREQSLRQKTHITLDEIARRKAIGDFKELNIIVKGDVDGSVEALSDSLLKLSQEEVKVNVVHKGVGAISESDVMLASASDGVIIGFQVRPSAGARRLAETEQIDIRLYSIIYDAINEVKDALEGMLSPELKEEIIGSAEIRDTFKISKVGTVGGCMVLDGKITRPDPIRLIRDGIVIYQGRLSSLRRFKDDVKEVLKGFECGLTIENYNDIKVGDIVEAYRESEVKRTLK